MQKDQRQQFSLCGGDKCCPTVTIDPAIRHVTIGEEGNLVTLDKAQWNELVAKVRSGELTEL